MNKPKTIFAYVHGSLQVGHVYNGILFERPHLQLLSAYITLHPKPQLFVLYLNKVKFSNFVGVIKIGDITIEVLPKTDRHEENTDIWQAVLLEMLAISLQVEAKTTTHSDILIKRHSVLETYINLFLDEVRQLVHHGLVKKYRRHVGNQTALKGKLLIHQHTVKNLVHAERFYVSHTMFDRDNVYNYILEETLHIIRSLGVSDSLCQSATSLLIDFPECKPVKISENLFLRLQFHRKTERYKTAIQLARIILMNYHPDVKGGSNNVLAIMFDMNHLWENYVYWILRKAARRSEYKVSVKGQQKALFWQHPEKWNLRLKPDLLLEIEKAGFRKRFVLDTKWKYKSDTSIEDVRQMYAYLHYFPSDKAFLVYPDNLSADKVVIKEGQFYDSSPAVGAKACGLAFIDLLENRCLNKQVAFDVLERLYG